MCATAPLTPPGAPPTAVPGGAAEFEAVDAALNEAFGEPPVPTAAGVARLRRLLDGGGSVRYAGDGAGGCAGAGSCSAPAAGTCELAGVGTRPAFRRRGVAGAVTAALTADLLARGAGSVWLESGGEGSRRVYEAVGFRPAGRRLYTALDGQDPAALRRTGDRAGRTAPPPCPARPPGRPARPGAGPMRLRWSAPGPPARSHADVYEETIPDAR